MPRSNRIAAVCVTVALLLPLAANAQTTDQRPDRERFPVDYRRVYGNNCPPAMNGHLVARDFGADRQPRRLDQVFPGGFRVVNEQLPAGWAPPVYRSTNKDRVERYLRLVPDPDAGLPDGLAHGVFVERVLGDDLTRMTEAALRQWIEELPADPAAVNRGDFRSLGRARDVCGFAVTVGPLDEGTGEWLRSATGAVVADDLLDPDSLLGSDDDSIRGLEGDDTLLGEPGPDDLAGDDDTITGFRGDDIIRGDDDLGGTGSDDLLGSGGGGALDGGSSDPVVPPSAPLLLGTDDGRHWVSTQAGDQLLVRSVPPAERPPELAALEARSPFLEVSLANGPLENPAAIAIVRAVEDLPRNDAGDIPVPLVAFRSEDGQFSTPQQLAFFVSKGDSGADPASAGAGGVVDDAADLAIDWTDASGRWLSTDGTGPALAAELPGGDWLAVVAQIEEPGQAFLFAGGPFLRPDVAAEVTDGAATFSGRLIAPAAFDARLGPVSVLGPGEPESGLDDPDAAAVDGSITLPTRGEPRQKRYRISVECPASGSSELVQVIEVRRIGAGSALFEEIGLPPDGGRTRLALPLTADCP